ncbi:MAG: PKD domain-containing protein, partial [Desulfobacula sp.]|jgi:subtilase family serine protease|nr:PKD domain-containing protein [Desulfobacula sp.]
VDLSAYANQKIRIAFYHVAGRDYYNHASESTGWYIDDVESPIVDTRPRLVPIEDKVMVEFSTLNVPLVSTDPDGEALTLTVMDLPAFGTFTDNSDGTGTLFFEPGIAGSGEYAITVTASDGILSDSEIFTLTVNDTNAPPNLTSIDDQEIVEGETLKISVAATDPDGDILTLFITGLPSFGAFVDNGDNTGTIMFNSDLDTAGSYSITVTASDGTLSQTDSFTLQVNNYNQAPDITPIVDYELSVTSTLSILVEAFDSDLDKAILSVTDLPVFGTFKDNGDGTGVINLKPESNDDGVYTITVIAADGILTSSYSFTVTVNSTTIPPYSADFSVNKTQVGIGREVLFTDLSSDNPVSWQWDFDNDGIIDSTAQNPSNTYYKTGIYSVRLTVTNADSTYEHIKTNHIRVVPLLPDLQVTHLEHSQAVAGETMEVTWTVTNTGEGTTNSPIWYDRVWISPDLDVRTGHNEDRLLGTFGNVSYLEPGESYLQTRQITLPKGLNGTYYLFVITDNMDATSVNLDTMRAGSHNYDWQADIVSELDNYNNFAFTIFSFTIPPAPDMQVASVTAPGTAISDQEININWSGINRGETATGDTQWYDQVYISREEEFNGNAIAIGSLSHTENLLVDGTYPTSSSFMLPHAVYGVFYVYVQTDSSNKINEYLFENNNISRSETPVNIVLSPPPDLTVTDVVAPDAASCGESIEINWTVENQGPGTTIEPSWYDCIYISNNQNFDQGAARLIKSVLRTDPLDPDISYADQEWVMVPRNIEGQYYIFVKTDCRNEVFEYAYEENNVLKRDSGIEISVPDIQALETNIPETGASGLPISVNWTVQNQGSGQLVDDTWSDKVYLSQSADFDQDSAIELGSISQSMAMKPDTTYLAEGSFNLQNGISGDYYVYVVLDSENAVFESTGENNNISRSDSTVHIDSSPWPDLRVATVNGQDNVTAGDRIEVTWEVKNYGMAATKGSLWTDTIYLSSSAEWDGNFEASASVNQSMALAISQSYSKTYALSVSAHLPSGDYYIYIKTDVNNDIYEHSDENNNISRSGAITVLPYPPVDLTVANFDASDAALSGQAININWTIKNVEQARTLTSWNDKIYLSLDVNLNPEEDILLKTVGSGGSLNAQADYARSITANIPNGISGDYYLILYADASNEVPESNENNNSAASAVSIELTPPPDLQITSFTIPSEGISGQPIDVNFTVENKGTGPANRSKWYDAVYLSANDVLDSSDIRLNTIAHTSVLNPTDSYNLIPDVELPGYVSGIYYVIIKTDNRNDIYEHDAEDNNVVTSQPIAITMLPPADLVVTDITVPESAAPGNPVTISWTIENQGQNTAVGRMKEGVYISENTTWEYTDPMLGTVTRNINLAPGASMRMSMKVNLSKTFAADAGGTITAILPGVATGEHYVAVRTDLKNNIRESDLSNNTLVSDDTITVSVASLEGNVPMEATVLGGHQKKYYRIDVAEDLDLKITLTSDVQGAANEVYVAFGRVPTLSDYDHAGNIPFTASQDVLVPSTQAGTYYIMIYARDLPSEVDSQNITLLIEPLSFSITGITPDVGGAGGRVTCTLTGAGFRETTQVFLRLSDDSLLEGKVVEFVNTMELKIRWDLSGVALGTYDIIVESDHSIQESLFEGFTIELSTGFKFETISDSNQIYRVGSNFPNKFTLINNGNVDIPFIFIYTVLPSYIEVKNILNSPNLYKISDIFVDMAYEDVTPGKLLIEEGQEVEMKLITFLTTNFSPGEKLNYTIVMNNINTTEFPLAIFTLTYDFDEYINEVFTDIEEFRLEILANPDETSAELLQQSEDSIVFREFVFRMNFIDTGLVNEYEMNYTDYIQGEEVSTNYMNHLIALNANNKGKSNFICEELKELGAYHNPVVFCWQKCLWPPTFGFKIPGFPVFKMNDPVNCIAKCTKILANQLRKCRLEGFVFDPNEIVGPTGYSFQNWKNKDQTLPYAIHFENDPELATVPALVVSIRQQLDPDLNIRKFRLGSFGFGDHIFQVPENRAYYTNRLDVVDSLGVYVDVIAGIDVTTNEAFWTFRSIDPDTGLPPTNPLAGFLPVNDPETGVGQGFVTYTIQAKEDTVTGDVIDAKAAIVFDVNEPVETPPIFNTIDADYPSSVVQSSVDFIDATNFEVSWLGHDVADGSGLGGYDILVSDNDAAYEIWLSNTQETSAYFSGEPGHTYRFYSQARDNAGNVEQAPMVPDVTVDDPPGSLTVTITPQEAIDVGAQWRADGGAWQNSGATATGLIAGDHTISYKEVSGWDIPTNETVTIYAGQCKITSGIYSPNLIVLLGDINNDGNVDILDTILALQVITLIDPPSDIYPEADVNDDGQIGLQEAIYTFMGIIQ